jgi:hypothetical protein
LSCLVAAVRPLRVEELAEVLAVDYEDEEGIPRLNPNWRWEDEEQALLASCSSLIAIVESDDSRVVQFSHFSVKEYLTSARLAISSGEVLRYHIALEPAHTILAQACMSALLRSEDHVEQDGAENNSQLAKYAAEHWASHAKYGNVSSSLQTAMEYLFDPDKPYFSAWRTIARHRHPPRIDSTFFLFMPMFEIRRRSAVLRRALWIRTSRNTPDSQVSAACEHPRGYYDTARGSFGRGSTFRQQRLSVTMVHTRMSRNDNDETPLHSAAYVWTSSDGSAITQTQG